MKSMISEGNGALLLANVDHRLLFWCWIYIHVLKVMSLLCYITNYLMTGPSRNPGLNIYLILSDWSQGKRLILLPKNKISMFPLVQPRDTLRMSRSKMNCFAWDQSLCGKYCSVTVVYAVLLKRYNVVKWNHILLIDKSRGGGWGVALSLLTLFKAQKGSIFLPHPLIGARKAPPSFPHLFTDTSCQNQTKGIQNTILNEFLGSKSYNFCPRW